MAIELTLDWNSSPIAAASRERISAADALVSSLRTFARVDIAHIATQLGTTEEEAEQELGSSVFHDPTTMELQTAEEYLSGDLYRKLDEAIAANGTTGNFSRNVAALKEALPPILPAEAIWAPLGSPWIPEDVIVDFIAHLMADSRCRCDVIHDASTGSWDIKNKSTYRYRPESQQLWGTERMPALNIVDSMLNGKPVRVTEEVDCPHVLSGKKRVLNHDETLMAVEKQRDIQREFESWLWADPARKDRLVCLYNERYCGFVRRRYDGSILDFPGMAKDVELRTHQKNAVMRILLERDVLVAHDVGAGKTYTAIAAIMELRRMGISHKNLVVVPNNVLGQWSSLFAEMYPKAKVLVVTPKSFVPQKRQAVLCSMRDDDHDAVLMAYSSFKLIPHAKQDKLHSLNAKIRELEEATKVPARNTATVRRELASCKKKRKQLVEEAKPNDEGITFGELGVTRLFVDEAQNFKNLALGGGRLRTRGFSRKGSAFCQHVHDAVRRVQQANGGCVFLSGTIVTNSICDLFVLQTYLQPGMLELLDLRSFEAWANMFARRVTGFEVDVDTSTYRHVSRFVGFGNLGELSSILSCVSDFHHLDAADGLPACDGRTDVLVPKVRRMDAYLKLISARVDNVRAGIVHPKDDNLLKICSDGHKAAIDIRLVDDSVTSAEGTKVLECAQNVSRIWRETAADRLTQLVFCDISTPKDGFNVYDELKALLVRMGVPAEEVAFVHDARTEAERTHLFEAMRVGKIRVLVGSTPKLGLGVNVQDRLVAAHHLDVPWRPADMVQREGRILRQGNMNDRVQIFRYVTEGSFDAYSWQILENKQRVIDELLAGTYEGRFLDSDVGDAALSYAEIKALAVNNPLLKVRVEVSNELERNLIIQRRTASVRAEMQAQIRTKAEDIEDLEEMAYRCRKDMVHLEARGPNTMDAGERTRMRIIVMRAVSRNAFQPGERRISGYYRGFTMVLPKDMDPEHPYLWLIRNARHRVDLIAKDGKGVDALRRMDNALGRIPARVANLEEKIAELYRSRNVLETELANKAADRSEQIRKCQDRLALIDMELEEKNERRCA